MKKAETKINWNSRKVFGRTLIPVALTFDPCVERKNILLYVSCLLIGLGNWNQKYLRSP